MNHSRILAFLCLSSFLFFLFVGAAPKLAAQEKTTVFSGTPLVFEENRGQVSAQYRFLARRSGVETLFGTDGVDIVVPASKTANTRLRIEWAGANPEGLVAGEEPLPGYSNYFHDSDSSRWLRRVPQFGRVEYREIYPGVDLLFHGNGDELEQDFLVKPDASADEIVLRLDRPAHLSASGDLEVSFGDSEIRLMRPVAYQDFGSMRKNVSARFVLQRDGGVSFRLGNYDRTRPLVIDPVFGFSTYLAGTGEDLVQAVTTDVAGNIYVTGSTTSTDFPVVNPEQPSCLNCAGPGGNTDAFVSKFDPTGHTLLYSTYVGGSNSDVGHSIALDQSGNILVAGLSMSPDFPRAGMMQAFTCQTNNFCFFVFSLKADGSAFNYSGVIGGSVGSYVYGNPAPLAVDSSGNAYLAGSTSSLQFQVTPGTLGQTPPTIGNDETFALKLDSTGKLVYSTFIPGNAVETPANVFTNDFPPTSIAVDVNGEVTLVGYGGPGLTTTPGVLESTLPGGANGFGGYILQLNAAASALNYATYVPGVDYIYGLAVDASGNSYVAGETSQTNLPVTANAFQKALNPNAGCDCNDGFVVKLDGQGKTVLAATYLSGTAENAYGAFRAIALDSKSNVFVGGSTGSADFPLKNPIVTTLVTSVTSSGNVMAQLSPDLSTLMFGSFLSAPDVGAGFGSLTMDAQDNAIVVGFTNATDYPTTPGSLQTQAPATTNGYEQFSHSFITKIDLSTPAPSVCLNTLSINFGTPAVNTPASQNLSLQNCGNALLQISTIVSSSPTVTTTQACNSIAAGATCELPLTFTPTDTTTTSGTLTLSDNAVISQQVVSFTGAGGVPQVYFPTAFSTADLLVGTHAEYFIPLENVGDANWIIANATTTGDFAADNRCTPPVTPGNICFLGVILTPSQTGTRTAALTITDNVAGSPHTIQLSGNGIAAYPVPNITQVVAIPTDISDPQIFISGNNFFPASQATVNGSPRTGAYLDEQSFAVTLTAADTAEIGQLALVVSNPIPGGGASNTYNVAVYAPIRNIGIMQTVYEPISGLVYASVSTKSTNYPNQVVVIDPATAQVVNAWSLGNGPNQLAVSDDGNFLYVGLDGDMKVAQVSLPSGAVNFTVGLGPDPINQTPMIADAIRVLPGQPHSWAATLCGVGYVPCGEGIAVFDNAVERPTAVSQSQMQPDSLLFIGGSATTLYGITLEQSPASFYKFTINSSGIAQDVLNSSGAVMDGGYLDTDGTSIYISNGEILNPTTLALQASFQGIPGYAGIKVDAPASRAYFAGLINQPSPGFFFGFGIEAFSLTNQQVLGSVLMNESITAQNVFRWGSNGLGVSGSGELFLLSTSLTSTSPQISLSGASTATVNSGTAATYGLLVTPVGGFTGAVTFSCANLPQYASCSFSPPNPSLAGTPVSMTATIATSQLQAQLLGHPYNEGVFFVGMSWVVALGLLPCFGIKSIRRHIGSAKFAVGFLVIILVFLPVVACGGGGSGTGGNPPPTALDTPKGTYTVNLTATGNGVSQTIPLTLTVQ